MRYLPIVLVLIAGLGAAHGDEKAAGPDFSRYPQTPAFQHYLSTHQAELHLPHHSLLWITTRFGNSGALEYLVTETGAEWDQRNVYNFADEARRRRRLSEAELVSLRAAIHELPGENISPPFERLLVISFRAGGHWVTRSYDRQALPMEMRQIYDIIGERFETKGE